MTYPCETKINKQIIWFLLWDLMYSTKTWPRLRQRSHGNILKLPQNPGHGVMCSSCWRLAGSELTKHIHPTICWPWSLRLLILESWFRWHQILGNSPSEGIGELNVTFGAVVLDCLPLFFWGEGTAMFFFFCIRVSPCSWKAGRVESERTGRNVLTFPVFSFSFSGVLFHFEVQMEILWTSGLFLFVPVLIPH